ncbi:MAG: DUF177 domain-containing protein [Syntrophomonadaceae bacterium]|nr:DUF177 domain-containing protein [Syntrophomonadaceae bacterium]
MRINLARLKLRPQQSEKFYLEEQGNNVYLQGTGCTFLDKIAVELQVENTGRMFLARGNIKTVLGLPCSRCLRDTSTAIDTDIELTMARAGLAGKPDADDETIIFHGDMVDLSIPVHEAVFMAIPIIPLCRPECKGLCPVCGKDLNQGTCSCSQKEIDPRWEKLKNL